MNLDIMLCLNIRQRFRALVYRSYAEGIISESKAAYLLDVPFEEGPP